MTNKDQDFPIWIQQFEQAVKRGHNPHSQRRHYIYCLQWLPGSLDTDAYAMWMECKHAETDWVELKKELEDKFEDPAIRKEWRDNPKALMWDESKESLHAFAAKVKRKVNTYDAELAHTDKARMANYVSRFTSGMPDDYITHLGYNMPTKGQKLEKALEICVRYQTGKAAAKRAALNTQKNEVGASAAFQDPTMPSRVTQNEHELVRLRKEVTDLKAAQPSPTQQADSPRVRFANHSPRPHSRQRGNYAEPRSADYSGDRWSRYTAHKRGGFNGRGGNRFRKRQYEHPNNPPPVTQQASLEEGLNLMSEPESAAEDLDDTIADFEKMENMDERERLEYFGALRDLAYAGN